MTSLVLGSTPITIFASIYAPNSNWNSEIIEFPGGKNPAVVLQNTLVISGSFPGSVILDNVDNLLVGVERALVRSTATSS